MIDPSRYPLITKEFRYAEVRLPDVGTVYAKARELELDGRFRDATGMSAIASAIVAVVGTPKRRFEVVVSGTEIVTLDSFVGRVRTVQLNIPELGVTDQLFALTRAVINETDNQTALECWGGAASSATTDPITTPPGPGTVAPPDPTTPLLDFSDPANSMYVAALLADDLDGAAAQPGSAWFFKLFDTQNSGYVTLFVEDL